MSLIPYHPREGREIVLRHRNAVVVRDRESHRLEIRGSECPTCHQPLGRASSPEQSYDRPYEMNHEYVDPNYFRMLRARGDQFSSGNGPPSPVRRLVEPGSAGDDVVRGSYPHDSTPAPDEVELSPEPSEIPQQERGRIRREAFSPNYFKTFFVEERVLGRGGKGVVLLVRHEIDGCPLGHFACKRVPVGDDHAWLEKVLIEVELLAKLSHPNLVSYRHVWLEDVRLTRFGPSVASAFILQQYCNGGDLHQYVVGGAPRDVSKEELKARMRRRSRGQADTPQEPFANRPQLSFEEIYSLFKDITSGVAYLHGANYIHRDLKPSNCLLHREGAKVTCLISDFGEVQPENAVRKSTGSTGTISYCAPEVLKMDASGGQFGNFTQKSDVFSLGMILYFMCFGRLPYQTANTIQEELEDIDELRAEIARWQGYEDERQQRPDLPSKLYRLLKKLLALNPMERPSANEVLLAMRSETNFDTFAKNEWPANPSTPSLRGNRIQNLDSPVPPRTPVSEPGKEHLNRRLGARSEPVGASSRKVNDERLSPEMGSVQDIIVSSHTRQRNTSHNFDDTDRGNEPSSSQNAAADATVALAGRPSQERPAPRLLMAPPRSLGENMWHQFIIVLHRAYSASGLGAGTLDFMFSSTLFLFKIASLMQSCWPFVPNLAVGLPLVLVAAAELGWPGLAGSGWRQDQWARQEPPRRSREQPGRLSLVLRAVLLGFHLGVIWIARQRGVVCTLASQEQWSQWREQNKFGEL